MYNKVDDKLFQQVLVDPIKKGFDELKIVTGFASYGMLERHLNAIKDEEGSIKLELIVGMTTSGGN